MTSIYPFSAVAGQERLKLALLLCAVDPGIGGVLVRGPRGVAKTTLARAFAELLPGRFVELPLGATEERVTGTLDLEAALEGRRVQFSPGLLARAHEGVLYVDEANLLPDPLVDLLLDAAASGSNVVERDGVSHAHPARFVLIGTMNPEEGELRAQIVDRFGLSVTADGSLAPELRAQIVLRRLEFERDAARFLAAYAAEQQLLLERCRRARERMAQLALDGPALVHVTELCHAAGVEGVRADLAMLRAARAHAAWHAHERIEREDVEAVAELALAHRRPAAADPSGSNPPGGSGCVSPAPGGAAAAGSAASAGAASVSGLGGNAAAAGCGSGSDVGATSESCGAGAQSSSERGALAPVPVRAVQAAALPEWLGAPGRQPPPARRRASPAAPRRGPRRPGAVPLGSIDWFATLAQNPRPTRRELRRRPRPRPLERLWMVAVDCSSSMLRSGGLAVAKGLAHALAEAGASASAHVALISFSGDRAHTLLISRARRGGLERPIATLCAGGGTPLRRALSEALAVCQRPAYRGEHVQRRLLVLTDGRTREDVTDLARSLTGLDLVIIDCERSAVRWGRSRRLAAALSGRYAHVDSLASASSDAALPLGAARR